MLLIISSRTRRSGQPEVGLEADIIRHSRLIKMPFRQPASSTRSTYLSWGCLGHRSRPSRSIWAIIRHAHILDTQRQPFASAFWLPVILVLIDLIANRKYKPLGPAKP